MISWCVPPRTHEGEHTDGLSESALSELRAAIDVDQEGDLIRHLAEWGLQQLIEAKAAEVIDAAATNVSRAAPLNATGIDRGCCRPRLVISVCRSPSCFPDLARCRREELRPQASVAVLTCVVAAW